MERVLDHLNSMFGTQNNEEQNLSCSNPRICCLVGVCEKGSEVADNIRFAHQVTSGYILLDYLFGFSISILETVKRSRGRNHVS